MAADPEPVDPAVIYEWVTQLADDHAELTALMRRLLTDERIRCGDQGSIDLHLDTQDQNTLRRLTGSP